MTTSTLRCLLPDGGTTSPAELLAVVGGADVVMPFDAERMDFVGTVSRSLSRAARNRPEMQALAYWMRPAELRRMEDSFRADRPNDEVAVPRGTVFHIPPANVDTMFAYSWVLAMATGNRNIVRLSSRSTMQSELILEVFGETLKSYPSISAGTAVVTYGHDRAVTAQISAASDVRVIWGGNETVNSVRREPLPPHGRDIAFPDRFSMAAFGVDAYFRLSDYERQRLAESFFNDAYWFDQLGCSSPRIVLWVGGSDAVKASADFFRRVRVVSESKNYMPGTATAIAKLAQSMRTMVEADVRHLTWLNNALALLDLSDFADLRGEFCGAGLFYQLSLPSLLDLVPHVQRTDQTLSVFGIPRTDLESFVAQACGRGIDRIVPIGRALAFNRVWDGMDLLQEFTRRVSIESEARSV